MDKVIDFSTKPVCPKCGVSVYEAGTVVATETFDVVISGMGFIDSPENENATVGDIERGRYGLIAPATNGSDCNGRDASTMRPPIRTRDARVPTMWIDPIYCRFYKCYDMVKVVASVSWAFDSNVSGGYQFSGKADGFVKRGSMIPTLQQLVNNSTWKTELCPSTKVEVQDVR